MRIAEGLRDHRAARGPGKWPWRPGTARSTTPWWSGIARGVRHRRPQRARSARVSARRSYYCFPHYFVLPTYSSASSYRFRPLGPEETVMEIWSLTRFPQGHEPKARRPTGGLGPRRPEGRPSRPRTSPTCPTNRRACTTTVSSTCASPRASRDASRTSSAWSTAILAGLPYEQLVPAMQKVNTTIDVPIADLDL